MYNTTDIHSLGTDYTVLDKKGNPIKNIQVIPHTEILEAALGPFDPLMFSSYNDYLSQSVSVLSGFEDIDPLKVMWYASTDANVVLSTLVGEAIKMGYDIIILERIEETE